MVVAARKMAQLMMQMAKFARYTSPFICVYIRIRKYVTGFGKICQIVDLIITC